MSDRLAAPALAPALALAIALPLPLGSLPLFALGYWDKAEPLVVWFHATAAAAALAVAIGLWRRPEATRARILHPFVLLPLALGLWSVLAAAATERPWLSLLGAPQSGFGALWFLDLAAYTACALLAAEQPVVWRRLSHLALGLVLLVALLKIRDWLSLAGGGDHLLIFVAAYYGWLALPLLALPGPRWLVLGIAATVAIASHSLTACGLLAGSAAMIAAAHARPRLAAMITPYRAMAAVAVAAALPWLLLHGLPALRAKESLRDRFLVQTLVQDALAADPAALLFGQGWGRTQDALQSWFPVAGERLWNPRWTFLLSDYFHSHNWALEDLLAVGIPGLLLGLAGFLVIPRFAATERRLTATAFALAYTLLHGLWFPLCLSVPLTAMALAALADRTSLGSSRSPPPHLLGLATAGLALAQLGAAAFLLSSGWAMDEVRAAWNAVPPRPVSLPADFRGSDLAAAEAIRDSLSAFSRRAQSEPTEPLAAAIRPMLAFIDAEAPHSPTILLLTGGLGAMSQIHVTGELAFAAAPEQMILWRRWLDRLLVLAPHRSDQAIPYFTACIAQGRLEEAMSLNDRLLALAADDPVALYYHGLLLLLRGDPGQRPAALDAIRRALEGGLDRFMPIDPKLNALFGRR